MTKPAPNRWAQARALYEDYGATEEALAICMNVTPKWLKRRARKEGWKLCTRPQMSGSILNGFHREIEQWRKTADASALNTDNLGKIAALTTTVEKLWALHATEQKALEKETANAQTGAVAHDPLELRKTLAQRIAAIIAERNPDIS